MPAKSSKDQGCPSTHLVPWLPLEVYEKDALPVIKHTEGRGTYKCNKKKYLTEQRVVKVTCQKETFNGVKLLGEILAIFPLC